VVVSGKEIWLIEGPSGDMKPHFYSGSVYIRQGATSQKITSAEEIRDMFQQSNKIYFENIPCPSVDVRKDIDQNNLAQFRELAEIPDQLNDEQVIANLDIINNAGVMNAAGVLVFHRTPEMLFFHAIVRCVLFKGTDRVKILDDKIFGGPLLQQYIKTFEWIQSKLRVEYIIEGSGPRNEKWEIPLDALKEAILNALCHRDYYEKGASITIQVFDDRVEITNPGNLLVPVVKEFGNKSLSRNPIIFGLFYRMNLIEHIASGIPRMTKAMTDSGLAEPIFKTEGMFTVILQRPANKTIKASTSITLYAITEIQSQILEIIRENPRATYRCLSTRLHVSNRTLTLNMKKLQEMGIIYREGSSQKGRWIIVQQGSAR
jgi:ATP-dependent DNA helicase RecG